MGGELRKTVVDLKSFLELLVGKILSIIHDWLPIVLCVAKAFSWLSKPIGSLLVVNNLI